MVYDTYNYSQYFVGIGFTLKNDNITHNRTTGMTVTTQLQIHVLLFLFKARIMDQQTDNSVGL